MRAKCEGCDLPKVRKTPQRMCVGCREMKSKKELLRVVKSPQGTIAFDPGGKMPGRGAYVCPDSACLKKAQKQHSLEHALQTAIGEEVYDQLIERLDAMCRAT